MFGRALGFGLMRLPLTIPNDYGSIDPAATRNMVDMFLERGFAYFDTAYIYTGSEEAAREAIVKRYERDRFLLADKLPVPIMEHESDNERILKEQLTRCGVDYFDVYLLHGLDAASYQTAVRLKCFEFLEKVKADGRARKTGLSFHDSAEVLDRILTEHPEIDVVQLQINYLDWNNPIIQSRQCHEVARRHNKPIIVMEPVKGGTLAQVPAEAERRLRQVHPDRSAASWAIRYAVTREGVVMVLSGMSAMEQMRDNIAVMENDEPLTAVEAEALEQAAEIINRSVAIPCTSCRYCVGECPKNIPIPECFNLYNNAMRNPVGAFYGAEGSYYANLTAMQGKASTCVACGKCEARCPQHLPIIQHLRQVKDAFESQGTP